MPSLRARLPAALLLLASLACASRGAVEDFGPAPLAYGVPQGGTATYTRADTVEVVVDLGGQTMSVDQTALLTLALDFTPGAAGLEVSARFEHLEARMDNPMAGTVTARTEDVQGPLVFTLDPRGRTTVTSAPRLDGSAYQFIQATDLAASLFPRLPARVVGPADTWVDTVVVRVEDERVGRLTNRAIVTYTVRGDTVVDGRTLLAVAFEAEETRSAETQTQGMTITQDAAGRSTGTFLWDHGAGRLHAMESSGRHRGTLEVPMAPAPLGVEIRTRSRLHTAGAQR